MVVLRGEGMWFLVPNMFCHVFHKLIVIKSSIFILLVPAVAITFPAEEETWYPNLRCDKLKSLAKQVYHTMELLPGYGKDMIKFAQAVGKENEKINLIGVRDVVVAMMVSNYVIYSGGVGTVVKISASQS